MSKIAQIKKATVTGAKINTHEQAINPKNFRTARVKVKIMINVDIKRSFYVKV